MQRFGRLVSSRRLGFLQTRGIFTQHSPPFTSTKSLAMLAVVGSVAAAYAGYQHFFASSFPGSAKDCLRRALVGQRTNEPYENVESEFNLAIKECMKHGFAESSREVIGILESLAEFAIERKRNEAAIRGFLKVWSLLSNVNTDESNQRVAAVVSRLGDILLSFDPPSSLLAYEFVLQSLIGVPTSSAPLVDSLSEKFGGTLPSQQLPFPATQHEDMTRFMPVKWASINQVITAVNNYATLFAQLNDKQVSNTMFLKCIKLVHDEYIVKGHHVPQDTLGALSVVCSRISNNFVHMDKPKEAGYWASEALEYAKMLNDEDLMCFYSINYSIILEQRGFKRDALIQITEAEKLARKLGTEEYMQQCAEVMKRLQ